MRSIILALIVILIVVLIGYWVLTADISALPQPGSTETRFAAALRNWYISRGARQPLPKPLPNDAATVSAGEGLFQMACSSCHGKDGRHPTSIGKSMYPRVPDLGSRGVQALSDGELFWVVKNGIRLSGMPGFGNILSNGETWQVAIYVRSLDTSIRPSERKD